VNSSLCQINSRSSALSASRLQQNIGSVVARTQSPAAAPWARSPPKSSARASSRRHPLPRRCRRPTQTAVAAV